MSLCGLAEIARIFSPEWQRRQEPDPSFVKLGVRAGFRAVSCAAESAGLWQRKVSAKMMSMAAFTTLGTCIFQCKLSITVPWQLIVVQWPSAKIFVPEKHLDDGKDKSYSA